MKNIVAQSINGDTTGQEMANAFHGSVMRKALALGVGAAALGMSRSAQAAANGRTHATFYFSSDPGNGAVQVPGADNVKVLNFALALEDLEADLYAQAAARLGSGGTSGTGTQFAGLGVSGEDVNYVNQFGRVEQQHADFIRSAIGQAGGQAIPKFTYDFNMENLDRRGVLSLVYAAELTGVSAYTGAIPFFVDKTYLAVASAILGTEARHTAFIAASLNSTRGNGQGLIATAPFFNENDGRDTPLTPDQILYQGGQIATSLSPLTQGVINPVSGPNGFIYA